MNAITCISPIDGSVYATRPIEGAKSVRKRLAAARGAQKGWAAVPLAERIELVREGVARLERVNADLVTELAWQMGRPVRYGLEMGGVRERTTYMAGIAERALAPEVIEDSESSGGAGAGAGGRGVGDRALELSVPDGDQHHRAGADRGQRGGAEACQPDAAGGGAAGAGVRALPEGVFTNVFLDHATTSALIGERAFDFINFTGSVRGGQGSSGRRRGPSPVSGWSLGARTRGTCGRMRTSRRRWMC